jgi:hypothetical protein
MAQDQIDAMVKTLIETQVIQALHSAPEAIELLVKAALSKPVDKNGNVEGTRDFSSYGGSMPYLDWMVGVEVRNAARSAAAKVIQEMMPNIEAEVRKGLSAESVVAAVTKSLIGTAEHEWRINVTFEAEKERR